MVTKALFYYHNKTCCMSDDFSIADILLFCTDTLKAGNVAILVSEIAGLPPGLVFLAALGISFTKLAIGYILGQVNC